MCQLPTVTINHELCVCFLLETALYNNFFHLVSHHQINTKCKRN